MTSRVKSLTSEKFVDGKQIIFDASSLQALEKCPFYYKTIVLDKWRRKVSRRGTSWGTAWHTSIEEFDRSLFYGNSRNQALEDAIKVAISIPDIFNRDDDNTSTLETLIRSLVWYEEHYREDVLLPTALPDGSPALETRFEFPLPNGKRV